MFGVSYLGSGKIPLYSPVFLGAEAVAFVTLCAVRQALPA